ncbi:DUF5522 domain-containing protein [Enterovibrio sp. ZSDZ35]|uniref:DUF5522 domain-containing protein n=2 Tax=Enterovibrio qingdaonensis TaxID=2899818 RepID=A0ABT5QLP8_9GAMM|nr:DUF5522 domain-containing protein [Enterovibrio sp. ZSDZ35]MDD1781913.1 DUF5522 domain-containing protein [Enterovibrio sp. ZSDZ35]
MSYPPVLSVPASDNLACLCPTCLAKRVNSKLDDIYQEYTTEDLVRLAKPYAANTQLIENIDYTKENGYMVLSAWYLLKRGKCCGNGCRHCPYGNASTNNANNVG